MRKLIAALLVAAPLTLTWAIPSTVTQFVWNAPMTYSDGAAVLPGDIASYVISCGSTPGAYTVEAAIADPTAVTYPIASLSLKPGDHFCVVQAVDKYGYRGSPSNEVRVFIDPTGGAIVRTLGAPGQLRVQ